MTPHTTHTTQRGTLVAVLAAAAITIAACSPVDDDATTIDEIESVDSTTDTSPDPAADTAETPGTSADAADVTSSEAPEQAAAPVSGGTLVFGLDAETDGWNPTASQWSGGGYAVGAAIFDPLTAAGDDLTVHPYLAESVEPNDDFTLWTITLRPGIEFHNGEPLNADALVLQFEKVKESLLIGQLFGPLESSSKIDDLTVEVQMSEPWASFPSLLATQAGYVAAPAQLNAEPDVAASQPIGTGPYVFDEWRRDDKLTATRNPAYWQDAVPYPDAVEFRVIPDPNTRLAAIETGQIDYVQTPDATSVLALRDIGSVNVFEVVRDQPGFIMLNTAVAPLDDVRVRRALALATDQQQLIDTLGQGLGSVADGPYRPESPWYSPSGYPTEPDIEQARALIEEYEADTGVDEVRFTVGCTPVGDNAQRLDLLAAQWSEAGIEIDTEFTEQAVYINNAIFGDYQANCWTQFGTPDPDIDATWWLSQNVNPPGSPALNFARLADPEIDAALREGRSVADPEQRIASYAKVWEGFAELVPYVWTGRGITSTAYSERVGHDSSLMLPDGGGYISAELSGFHPFLTLWVGE